jgi:hypothetical protein
MYALQCTQCDPRNNVPQVRVQEPAPEKQGAKSVIEFSHPIPLFFFGIVS